MCHVFSPSRAVLSYDMLWIFEAFHETCRQASMLSGAKRLNERAKQAERGLGENKMAGEPVHFVLMPSIHDTSFWHHDLIGQIADC